jgi:MoxR-like ATPase
MADGPLFTGSAQPRAEPLLPPPLEPQLRETGHYIPSEALKNAVEVALLLGQPLLLTGEPGTGKTTVAAALAHELFAGRFLQMQVKSGSGRDDLLYRIDEMARFRDAQPNRTPLKLLDYFELRPLGEAIVRACPPDTPLLHRSGRTLSANDSFLNEVFGSGRQQRVPVARDLLPDVKNWTVSERWVVLVDEIDKAPRDTPNDLLEEFERMEFAIPELNLRVRPHKNAPRPVVIVTSNSEKSLPDAFLRRCAFHHITFPTESELRKIIVTRLENLLMNDTRLTELLRLFDEFRSGMQRKPGTAELLQWLRMADSDAVIRTASNRAEIKGKLRSLVAVVAKQESDISIADNILNKWAT